MEKLKIKRKKIKENKGITIVALAITVIVMLILVTISIGGLFNGNGVIQHFNIAKENTRAAKVQEKIKLAVLQNKTKKQLNKTEITREQIIQELLDSGKITEEESTQLITNSLVIGEITIDISELNEAQKGILTDEQQIKREIGDKGYVGYYADIEDDGIVDGVIYADLAVGVSGDINDTDYGYFSYNTTSNLKKYKISEKIFGEQTEPGIFYSENTFGENPVIVLDDNSGVDRFYVMALEDIVPKQLIAGNSYNCWNWYWRGKNLPPEMNVPKSGIESNDFGQGKSKTLRMIEKWNERAYGYKDTNDLWEAFIHPSNPSGVIDANKWFIPSKAEWVAFVKNVNTTMCTELKNKGFYWSSTQADDNSAYIIDFKLFFNTCGIMIDSDCYAILSTTF